MRRFPVLWMNFLFAQPILEVRSVGFDNSVIEKIQLI